MWRIRKVSEQELVVVSESQTLPPTEVVIYSLFGPYVFCSRVTPAENYTLELYFTWYGYITLLSDNTSFIYLVKGNRIKDFYKDFSLPKAILM